MKNFVLATLICGGLAQLGGCIIVGDDEPPPPPPPGPGEFLVTWTLLGGEAQGEVTCPPNGVDVRVTVDDRATQGVDEIYLDDCVDGETLADDLLPGNYDVWVEVLDASGALVAASDIQENIPLDNDEQVPLTFEFSVDRGFFAITWDITEADASVTCADVGGDIVSLLLTLANTTEGDDFIFTCEDGQAVSDPMPLGDYVAVVSLLDDGPDPNDRGDDTLLGDSIERNVALDFGNQFEDLGGFTFVFP